MSGGAGVGCPRSPLPAAAGSVHSSPPPSPTSSPARRPPSRPSSALRDSDVRFLRPVPRLPVPSRPPLRPLAASPRPRQRRGRAVRGGRGRRARGRGRSRLRAPRPSLPRRHSQRSHPAVPGVRRAPPQLLLAPRGLGALPGLAAPRRRPDALPALAKARGVGISTLMNKHV